MIVMVRARTSYTTKVLLTTKLLFAPRFAFSSFIPLVIPLNPYYLTSILAPQRIGAPRN
jgi:hypothetical protein